MVSISLERSVTRFGSGLHREKGGLEVFLVLGSRPPGSAEGQNGVVSCNDCAFQPSTARQSSAQVQLRKRSRDPMAAMAPMPAMGLASWSQDDPKLRG